MSSRTSLPVRVRIEICRVSCQRHRERIASLERADRYVERLMDELDQFDVSSDHYHVFMSQRIAIWADLEDVRGRLEAETSMFESLVRVFLRGWMERGAGDGGLVGGGSR